MGHPQGSWHPWALPPSHLALLPSVAACLSSPALLPSVLSLALQAQPLGPEQACPPRPSWGGTCSGGAGRSRGAAGDGVLWRPVVSSEPGAAGVRRTPGGECAPKGVEDAGV